MGYDTKVKQRKESKKSTKGFVVIVPVTPGSTLAGLRVDKDTG